MSKYQEILIFKIFVKYDFIMLDWHEAFFKFLYFTYALVLNIAFSFF